jgi:signal transduction histidine kinase
MLDSERMMQRKAEKALGDAEGQLVYYKMLMEKVDTAVVMVTESGHVEWMNSCAEKMVGESCVLPHEVMKAIESDVEIVKLEGKEYALSTSVVTVGGGRRIIVAMKDIQGAMERTEVDSWHKLVRVLTHEIMNSITPIISLSETLSDMAATEVSHKSAVEDGGSLDTMAQGLDVIRRRSQGLLTFVENYRKLTRVALPVKTDVKVADLFADLRKLYTQNSVVFDIEGDDDVCIYADRGQMEQVLINLLKNAVEASDSASRMVRCCYRKVCIDGRERDVLRVEDNGKGILPDVLERIFVPFFTTKKNGSGIGLSLCKQIVMNHGGEISVKSEDGRGTAVEIKL